MIKPAEATALAVPAANTKFYRDCERAEVAIRVAAGEGRFCVDVEDVHEPQRLVDYLKSCGYSALLLGGSRKGAWICWPGVTK